MGTTPVIQGGALNMSTTNTLLAYSTAGTVGINGNNGVDAAGAPVRGNQSAVNTFNASTLVGTNLSVGAQQLADGLNAFQSGIAAVNRALAYSPGNQAANIDPSVANLNQTASVGMNALNLQQSGTTATNTTLSGLQTTGYNTSAAGAVTGTGTVGSGVGSVPIAISANEIAASTVNAGGFMPASANSSDWVGFANTTASGMPMPGAYYWVGSAQNGVAFLGGSFNPNAVSSPYPLNAGTVNVANAAQAVNLTNNTVSAGSSVTPMNVTLGPAGFEQRTGEIGIASNASGMQAGSLARGIGVTVGSPGGLSNAQALTGIGAASIDTLGQAFQSANNTLQGSGDVSGTLTQNSTGVRFLAAYIRGDATWPMGSVNGGSGLSNGASNNAYTLNGIDFGSALNNAAAGAGYGPSSLSGVGQAATTSANIAAAAGTIDTTASGTLAQSLGAISNYVGTLNAAVASSMASGNAAATNTSQSLNLAGNAVQAAAVNGSIAQVAEGSGTIAIPYQLGARNGVLVSAGNGTTAGQGSAALSGTTQANTTTLNAIQSAGALGSSTVPAAFSQQLGTVDTQLGVWAFSARRYGLNRAFIEPSNLAVVQTTNGAGASATANDTQQVARLSVNSLAGGTATQGLTGNATQSSYGQETSIGNQALAYAANAANGPRAFPSVSQPANNYAIGGRMLGAQGVMGGNAALTNQQQVAGQSLNTMSLSGASNGNLNQATFGLANQTTGNQLYAQSNGGNALATGAQSATNAVNAIAAR